MSPVGTIDWGGTWIRAALIEEGVRVSEIARARRPDSASRQIELVAGLLDALSEGSARPDAVGVGVAGVVREGGRIASAGNLGLGGAELQADLAARLALPVRVVNDTQAAALAEARASGRAGTLVLLSVGTGIGGAIVADGRLVPGRGAAGDFGHTPVMLDGPRCICGGSGCLEQVVSGRVLDEVARTLAGRGESSFLAGLAKDRPPHGGDLEDAAADGDPSARQALEQSAGALVTGLRAVAAALDPDV
ncbi:MAG: glucokinase, partial [Acidimicrobiaceae bacterium]|nr:glucokinase [Acidimicrobiaceae bacterium]